VQVLTSVYPLPHRVICSDELVHFAGLVTLAELDYDTGWLKRLHNMNVTLAYLFLRKAMNTICHVRSISDQLVSAAQRHPAIAKILRLVLQVALLGNMPHCSYRLGDASRIRVRLALGGDMNDKELHVRRLSSFFSQKNKPELDAPRV
jgi:hypothetical protein